ncbi:SpaH/EbpB family LPXTG-anchored major pilin [Leucobacter viscericola]|uniref:SpaH/EbpB family LPXTG-anchored major pilin n=1 Tax=Leucobacter viscericola TaxID=2714935 RepID=A0A6G7XFQ9_9MICO|nr:SpaH/EbpB family LPXTG-anchored major pilin [Leucobacter viscericola]QIK63450.1 SpaH/EbpB family LPXTG-anchored major pilin [Leucobacter viscericola]
MTNNLKNKRWRGAVALLAACAVGVVAFAAPAAAAPPAQMIDTSKKGSITVTKFSTPDDERPTTEGNGKPGFVPSANSTLLDGATFEVFKVGNAALDLTKNSGWQYLEGLISNVGANPTAAAITGAGATLTTQGSKVTGADGTGVAKWSNLDIGAYYVLETNVPAGHKASAPFFVTIPMTDPDNLNTWMYDVHVFPKNIQDDTAKVPLDTDKYTVGQELTWEIRTTIPGDGTNDVKIMTVTDTPSAMLDYKSVTMQIGNTWQNPIGTNVALSTPADFTVAVDGPTRKISATLTPTGLAKANGNKGATLLTRVLTEVNASYPGQGVLENTGGVITNKPGSDTETEESATPPSITKYADVKVEKINDAKELLNGAEFDVYYSHSATPDFSLVGNATTGFVKMDGVTCIMGAGSSCEFNVRFSDFAENTQLGTTDARYNYYWLVETKAPKGYELLAEPWGFTVTKDNVNPSFQLTNPVQVVNVIRGAGLELPFTGGAGTVAFLVVGIALLAGATSMIVIRSRQRKAQA